jgi:hypothetical protein
VVDPSLGVETVQSDETRLKALIQRYLSKRGVSEGREAA